MKNKRGFVLPLVWAVILGVIGFAVVLVILYFMVKVIFSILAIAVPLIVVGILVWGIVWLVKKNKTKKFVEIKQK